MKSLLSALFSALVVLGLGLCLFARDSSKRTVRDMSPTSSDTIRGKTGEPANDFQKNLRALLFAAQTNASATSQDDPYAAGGQQPSIPTLDPMPKLQQLSIEAPTVDGQNDLIDLYVWIKASVSKKILGCWRQYPAQRVWAQVMVKVEQDNDEEINLGRAYMSKFHGGYYPDRNELKCFEEQLVQLSGRRKLTKTLKGLKAFLPFEETVLVEWPCGNCRQP